MFSGHEPSVMGVLNVTPDSFYDGGRFRRRDRALAQARKLVADGARIIDVGGESSRPGAEPVSLQEELDRVIPVIEDIASDMDVMISVDTYKPLVMREAVAAGAGMINDIYALQAPEALATAARLGVPVCLMHMRGQPQTMQDQPQYDNVVEEVLAFLQARVQRCCEHGLTRERLLIDPGIGFGKTVAHNLSLLRHLRRFVDTGVPVLVGVSRKSLLGKITGRQVDQRLAGSVALAGWAAFQGVAVVRAHDVAETVDALRVMTALRDAAQPAPE